MDTDNNGNLYVYSFSKNSIYIYNISTAQLNSTVAIATPYYFAVFAVDKNGIYYYLSDSNYVKAYFLISNASIAFTIGALYSEPKAIATLLNGNIYYIDTNYLLCAFNKSHLPAFNFSVPGATGFAVDNSGKIYVSYMSSIVYYNATGSIMLTVNTSSILYGIIPMTYSAVTGYLYALPVYLRTIEILNSTGGIIKSYNADANLFNPYYIAINRNSGLVAIGDGSNKVKLFSNNGVFLSSFGNNFYSICSIAIDSITGNIIVCNQDAYGSVQLFDSTGKYLLSIINASTPNAITVDKNSNIYIYYRDLYYISVFRANGSFLFSFGSFTNSAELGKFNDVTSLAITNNGSIAAFDYVYNRIQLFDTTGKFIRVYNFIDINNWFQVDGNNDFITTYSYGFAFYSDNGSVITVFDPAVYQINDNIIPGFDILQDKLYVIDYSNTRITVISTNGAFATYPTNSTLNFQYCY